MQYNGHSFENLFVAIFADGGNHSSEKEDKCDGFDCRVDRLPVDATMNFSHKNNMEDLGSYVLDRGITLRFGMRVGNDHRGFTAFDEPVLVAGIEMPGPQWLELAEEAMIKSKDTLKDYMSELYWSWYDTHVCCEA